MTGLGYIIQRWWNRKFPLLIGTLKARAALRDDDYARFAVGLALVAFGLFQKRRAPKLIYSTSIDTDQSFAVRVVKGRRPIARFDVTVDR